jgi:hypothetical protein
MILVLMGDCLFNADQSAVLHLENSISELEDAIVVGHDDDAAMVIEYVRSYKGQNVAAGVAVKRGGRLIKD